MLLSDYRKGDGSNDAQTELNHQPTNLTTFFCSPVNVVI